MRAWWVVIVGVGVCALLPKSAMACAECGYELSADPAEARAALQEFEARDEVGRREALYLAAHVRDAPEVVAELKRVVANREIHQDDTKRALHVLWLNAVPDAYFLDLVRGEDQTLAALSVEIVGRVPNQERFDRVLAPLRQQLRGENSRSTANRRLVGAIAMIESHNVWFATGVQPKSIPEKLRELLRAVGVERQPDDFVPPPSWGPPHQSPFDSLLFQGAPRVIIANLELIRLGHDERSAVEDALIEIGIDDWTVWPGVREHAYYLMFSDQPLRYFAKRLPEVATRHLDAAPTTSADSVAGSPMAPSGGNLGDTDTSVWGWVLVIAGGVLFVGWGLWRARIGRSQPVDS